MASWDKRTTGTTLDPLLYCFIGALSRCALPPYVLPCDRLRGGKQERGGNGGMGQRGGVGVGVGFSQRHHTGSQRMFHSPRLTIAV